jgi:chemotaxis protein CheX
MNDPKKDNAITDYFLANPNLLKADRPLTFDCYIHFPLNEKIVHWVRKDAVFSAEKKEKLEKLEDPRLLVANSELQAYLDYVAASEPKAEVDGRSVFGRRGKPGEAVESARYGSVKFKDGEEKKAAEPKTRVDADFLNAVISATVEVFQDRFLTPVKARPPQPRKAGGAAKEVAVDVASFVALTTETIRGTIGLCFPLETYRHLLSKITGVQYKEVPAEMCLGSGEFMSAVYSAVRPKLMDMGYMIDRAIPTMIVGKDLSIPHLIPDMGFSITFDASGGSFRFEIGIKTGA